MKHGNSILQQFYRRIELKVLLVAGPKQVLKKHSSGRQGHQTEKYVILHHMHNASLMLTGLFIMLSSLLCLGSFKLFTDCARQYEYNYFYNYYKAGSA